MKQTWHDNYRVEAEPDFPFYEIDHKQSLRICEGLKEAISRHCDVSKYGVHVVWDKGAICSFCSCEWESCFDEDEICCCDEAVVEQSAVLAVCRFGLVKD